jgi:hypothetical protein
MKECDISKIHISSSFILSVSLLIMFDTLLLTITTLQLSATLHHTSPNYISLHFATLHHISPHFAQLHFTTLIDTSLPLICTSLIPPNLFSAFMAGYRVNCTLTVHLPFFPWLRALLRQDIIVEVLRSHSDTLQSVGLLWTSDQPDAETST